jgi:hypothetical protein
VTDPTFDLPERGPTNRGPRRAIAMHADHSWLDLHWYEMPREDPAWPEIYAYTDRISYAPGETVRFHASGTAPRWRLQVYRDGGRPVLLHDAELPGTFTPVPKEAYKAGCGWPVATELVLPGDLPSGFYRVAASCPRADGSRFLAHHFFVVRPTPATRRGRLLMLLPTATWTAYNDWGGSNHYQGIDGPAGNQPSPVLSLERPWARGLLWLPEGAPRTCTSPPPRGRAAPAYTQKEWSFANGFTQYSGSAGWAQFDRHFLLWAEREGYALDMITQTDLHHRPELLDLYPAVVITGHDEYWSREMRLAMEAWLDRGGRLARLGGNICWQIRLEDEGRRQVCYKGRAHDEDPVRGTADARLLTSGWEDAAVNWPGATTFGVNGFRGVYSGWGGLIPRGQRGFTVYRPAHWLFAGTELGYGDVFGAEAEIFAYEVDGLDYTFRNGLPYPTGRDGAPPSVEILAMAPAVLAEAEQPGEGFRYHIGANDLEGMARLATGALTPEAIAEYRYGAGMIVHMTRGRGEVVSTSSCEWVMGLARNDLYTRQITRNVLDRFIAA